MFKKNYFLGLLIAVGIPLICFFILKYKSERGIHIPPHYIYDTVIAKLDKDKIIYDTIWHTLQNFKLVNQLGDTVELYDKKGKILVIDFFFTRCAGICPVLTKNMQQLQYSFLKGGNTRQKIDTPIIQFISFSIDPEHDSTQILKNYADRFKVNHDNWWMLHGNKKTIYDFAFEDLKVDKFSDEPVNPNFIHTSRFILIDKNLHIRGYYNGLDSTSISKLARDIGILMLEKQSKSTIFTKIANIKWILIIICVLVLMFLIFMRTPIFRAVKNEK